MAKFFFYCDILSFYFGISYSLVLWILKALKVCETNESEKNSYCLEISFLRFWNSLFFSTWVFLAIKTLLSICIASLKMIWCVCVFSNFVLWFEREKKEFTINFYFATFTTLLVKNYIARNISAGENYREERRGRDERSGEGRGKEREERGEAEKNPKKAFLFSQSPHSE